ncbi:hypothetical protein GJAV_G00207930 [Gymnothorax javanicus]|nr:hypothetical protein GJAV_G00207930 [Gymnothorax javanicus]
MRAHSDISVQNNLNNVKKTETRRREDTGCEPTDQDDILKLHSRETERRTSEAGVSVQRNKPRTWAVVVYQETGALRASQ